MSVRRVVAALGATLLLAGCGGDPKPKVEPTPTSPITSPTATSSVSAKEFVRRWVEVANEMQVSGDTDEYRQLSTPCDPCIQTAKRVEQIYGGGGHIQTRGWVVRRTKFIDNGGVIDVDLWFSSSPTVIFHGNGKREHLNGGPNHFVLSIARQGDSWAAQSLAVYSQ